MAKVYFKLIDSYDTKNEISAAARTLLEHLITEDNIKLESTVPLMVQLANKFREKLTEYELLEIAP